jgi:hypothetical protein
MGVTRTGPAAYKYQELVDGKVRWRKESRPLPGEAAPAGRNPNFPDIYKVVLKSTGQIFRIWANSAKNAIWQVRQQFAHPPLPSAFRAEKIPGRIRRNASPSWHAHQAAEAEAQAGMIGGSPDKPSRQYLLGVQKAHEKSIVEAKRNPAARNHLVIGAPEVKHVTVVKGSQPHQALTESGWTLARVEGDKAIMLPPKGNPRACRNPGTDMASLMATNEFKKGVKLYEQIHGCPPKSVRRVVLPMGGKQITGRAVVVSLGKAPAESYEPRAGSRKHGRIWVHPYDHKPEKVVTADGRLIMTLPGTHAVKPGPDGEAWIHG